MIGWRGAKNFAGGPIFSILVLVLLSGCDWSTRQDPLSTRLLPKNLELAKPPVFTPVQTTLPATARIESKNDEANLLPGRIVGPPLVTVQAADRTQREVLGKQPNPPQVEDFNQLADQLISSLDSNSVDANLIFAEEAPTKRIRDDVDEAAPDVRGFDGSRKSPLPIVGESKSGAWQVDKNPPLYLAQAKEPKAIVSDADPWAKIETEDSESSLEDQERRALGLKREDGVTVFGPDREWSGEASDEKLPKEWKPGKAPGMDPEMWDELVEEPKDPEGHYRLGPGDAIDVSVLDVPELSRALSVRPDGYISFPMIREIKAGGMTPSELEEGLTERLSEHLIDPEVSVIVNSVGSKAYYVFGAVAGSGVYQYFRDTTLLQAIVTAGGFASFARRGIPAPHGDLSRVRIIRTNKDHREIITKNLKNLSSEGLLAEDIPIQSDDIIYVPDEERLVYVFGQVGAPGVVQISTRARMLEALLDAGGVLPTGKKEQILLIRPGEGNQTSYLCTSLKGIQKGIPAANVALKDGDIIYVPQKFIAKVAEFVALYTAAIQPALQTYLTSWDAWFVHERFSALRANEFGLNQFSQNNAPPVNPDP